ncbi:3-dehydroquinate synthase [Alicyclobacillus acidiphilus]|uniref:3-dehydroquinate synthase n=1 Tax=Alicyclobacillus acidiphilus TaxID=182455 RepID=UPI00082F0E88|nr:3-dehydroquinate synthase [Alicyclobacillus acidiphilus]
MRTLTIRSQTHSYPVVVGEGVLEDIAERLKELGLGEAKVTVVTDNTVRTQPIARQLEAGLSSRSQPYQFVSVPAGDASKSLSVATDIYNQLIAFGMRRRDLIIALGGGVIGDLAGFVAATYLRGIPFIQAPTTLLAHDSALGGKVGVNLPQGKNLVGAFYPPRAVLFDTRAVLSLPARQWTNGMAEVIKHALIGNPKLFEQLEAKPLVSCPTPAELEPILADAMQVKVDVVNQDEHEQGLRQVLNVGHTIGHAIEQRSNYALGHGEAISIGLVLEAELAVRRNMFAATDRDRLRALLAAHGLPVAPPKDDFEQLAQLMAVDKKHGHGRWTFALPTEIGHVEIVSDVDRDEVQDIYRDAVEGKS